MTELSLLNAPAPRSTFIPISTIADDIPNISPCVSPIARPVPDIRLDRSAISPAEAVPALASTLSALPILPNRSARTSPSCEAPKSTFDNLPRTVVISDAPPWNSSPNAMFTVSMAAVNSCSAFVPPETPNRPASVAMFSRSTSVVGVFNLDRPSVNASTCCTFRPVVLRTLA